MNFLKKVRRKKGFTLIELMIVIAIIAILAAIAIPQYNAYREKAKAKDLLVIARNCAQEIAAQCIMQDTVNATKLAACNVYDGEEADDVEPYLYDVDIQGEPTNYNCSTGTATIIARARVGDDDTGPYYRAQCTISGEEVECQGIFKE